MHNSETPKAASFAWLAAIFLTVVLGAIAWVGFIDIERSHDLLAARTVVGTINNQEITLSKFEQEIGLQLVRNTLLDQASLSINQAVILNRMIGDVLLLQGAQEAGVLVNNAEIQETISSILVRYSLTDQEFDELLSQAKINRAIFEGSIQDYLTIVHFVDEVVLLDVAPASREAEIQTWMMERFEMADLDFDQSFLDSVNSGQ